MILHDQLEPLWKGLHSPFILCIYRVFCIESLQLFSFTDWIKNANTRFIAFYSILQAFFIKVQLNSFKPFRCQIITYKDAWLQLSGFQPLCSAGPKCFSGETSSFAERANLLAINMFFKLPFTEFFLATLGVTHGPPGFAEHRLRTAALAGAAFCEHFRHYLLWERNAPTLLPRKAKIWQLQVGWTRDAAFPGSCPFTVLLSFPRAATLLHGPQAGPNHGLKSF